MTKFCRTGLLTSVSMGPNSAELDCCHLSAWNQILQKWTFDFSQYRTKFCRIGLLTSVSVKPNSACELLTSRSVGDQILQNRTFDICQRGTKFCITGLLTSVSRGPNSAELKLKVQLPHFKNKMNLK